MNRSDEQERNRSSSFIVHRSAFIVRLSMRITEIFFSIQGESSHAGTPCVFVRLTGCSLRCVYCDTKYSYGGGRDMTLPEVLSTVETYPAKLVEVTGGEPLEQEEVYPLMTSL